MASSSKRSVTELLGLLREGKSVPKEKSRREGPSETSGEVPGELFDEIYSELRHLARGQRKRWRGDPTLQTTALAHEAYLKLVEKEERSWESRSHFFAVAAKAIRQILLNRARRKKAQKRGGTGQPLSLEKLRELAGRAVGAAETQADEKVLTVEAAELLLTLDEALSRFEETHPRAARGVDCRFFGGMTIEETAEVLGVSSSTVSRDWIRAKAWLYREIKRIRGEAPGEEPDRQDPGGQETGGDS